MCEMVIRVFIPLSDVPYIFQCECVKCKTEEKKNEATEIEIGGEWKRKWALWWMCQCGWNTLFGCLDMESVDNMLHIRSSEAFNEQSLHKQYSHDIYWIHFGLGQFHFTAFSAYYVHVDGTNCNFFFNLTPVLSHSNEFLFGSLAHLASIYWHRHYRYVCISFAVFVDFCSLNGSAI